MMPIGSLMTEHRLIERMIKLMKDEMEGIEESGKADPVFVDTAVDFFRFFADRCHHGKEENIFFAELATRALSDEHRKTMNKLVEEHVLARKLVGQLLLDKEKYVKGDPKAVQGISEGLRALTSLYPHHIETEDKHFFIPCMEYFTQTEREEMIHRFGEFDRKLTRERYGMILEELEARRERNKA